MENANGGTFEIKWYIPSTAISNSGDFATKIRELTGSDWSAITAFTLRVASVVCCIKESDEYG
jgi:hypothetical protein